MRRVAFAAVIVCLPLLAQTAPVPSVDELIAHYIAARGGIDKLKAVAGKRFSGHISFNEDVDVPFLVEQKRPGMMRTELTLRGMTYVRVFDGNRGWQERLGNGKVESGPSWLSGDDTRNLSEEADFDGALVDYRSKGGVAAYAGRIPLEGKSTYKIKLRLKDGNVFYYYLDAGTSLETKWEGGRDIEGRELMFESVFRDYRAVDGQRVAFRIDSISPENGQRQTVVFDRVEMNPPIDSTRFAFPAGGGNVSR